MPRYKQTAGGAVQVDLGTLNPKQKQFCQSRSRYTAYGGARGGGKTHVLLRKAAGGALTYPGIKILIVRREYPELEQNIILPMQKLIPPEVGSYNGSMRMMFFCNGVDREYREGEKAKDYTFIPATVDDNPQLLEASPEYKQMLDLLPEDVRRAWRYGDWNAMAGTFFPEFRRETHVIAPFVRVPREWKKYRAFDYGLDMFACLWVAVDFEGRAYVYREVQQSGLIVSEAAKLANALTPPEEHIEFTIAPPDMWNRQKDSGRSMAEIFAQNGLGLLKASNNRVQGWMAVKELLKPMKSDKDRPGLLVTENCVGLIRNLPSIQHDEKNPSDCATEPHEITHICDAARYFCVTRVLGAQKTVEKIVDDFDEGEDYDEAMTGGEMTADYLSYG